MCVEYERPEMKIDKRVLICLIQHDIPTVIAVIIYCLCYMASIFRNKYISYACQVATCIFTIL